jgi:hypothetical protein
MPSVVPIEKSFRAKSFDEVKNDIDEVSLTRIPRVLADGDALILPQNELVQFLDYLKLKLRDWNALGLTPMQETS